MSGEKTGNLGLCGSYCKHRVRTGERCVAEMKSSACFQGCCTSEPSWGECFPTIRRKFSVSRYSGDLLETAHVWRKNRQFGAVCVLLQTSN
jgi:hypothetical protein